MRKYLVRLCGNSAVGMLEFKREELDVVMLREWAARALPHYWPVYTRMYIFRDEEDDSELVVDLSSYVAVRFGS